jgi:hypothetical protein
MKELIKSKINLVEAQIEQYKNSELFSISEKDKLISPLEIMLENYQLELAKEIETNQPEIL